jgi:ribosomal protein S18 acetylase RimI-like enzyme
MVIRLGLESDFKKVIKLFQILDKKHSKNRNDFKKSIDQKRYTDILEKCNSQTNYILTVAEKDNKIIGFGIGKVHKVENHPFLKNQIIGEILYLIVTDEFKQKGIGRSILEYLEAQLIIKKADRLELRVYNFNKEAYPERLNYEKKFTIYEKLTI